MGEHIWLVRNPEGRVIGASVCSADGAISDASFSGKFSKTEFFAFIRAMKHDGLTRSNGYILTREALAPTLPAGQREPLPTGTAGVTVTEDDEKITMTVGPVTEAEAVAALKRHGWAEQAFHFGSFRYRSLVAVQRGTAALTRTGGVKYLDSVLVAIVCDVRGGMSTTAILDKYRAALAASTRTGEDAHPTTPTRGSDVR